MGNDTRKSSISKYPYPEVVKWPCDDTQKFLIASYCYPEIALKNFSWITSQNQIKIQNYFLVLL